MSEALSLVLNALLVVLALASVWDLVQHHTSDRVDAGVCAVLMVPVFAGAQFGFSSASTSIALVGTVLALRGLLYLSPDRIETDPNDSIFAVLRMGQRV